MSEASDRQEAGTVERSIIKADIVVLAQAHNPSILSPEWLQANCGVEEKPKDFVHTAHFSLFDSESLQLTVDQTRLQIVAKKPETAEVEMAASVASRYASALPHIPYVAVGLNYVWTCAGGENNLPKIGLTISQNPLTSVLKDYNVSYGGIVYGCRADHRLKVLIERAMPSALTFNFNFHFDLDASGADRVISCVGSFGRYLDTSSVILSSFFSGGDST